MAVIITNMDMPRGCYECPLREDHGWEGDWCAVSEGCDLIGETTRPDFCPLIEVVQEPFINKPCVSSGVCEHDKQKVLDKVRAEIEKEADASNRLYGISEIGLRKALKIIDKYKAEIEPQESEEV